MKKWIACVLACFLLCGQSLAELSLPEKFDMQVASGSGVRGDYELLLENETIKQGVMKGSFSLIKKDGNTYFKLLDDSEKEILSFNDIKKVSALTLLKESFELQHIKDRENAVIGTILNTYLPLSKTLNTLISILNFKFDYQFETPLLEKQRQDEVASILKDYAESLKTNVDIWLQDYIVTKENTKDKQGNKVLGLEYDIPIENLKTYILTQAKEVAQNQFLLEALQESLPKNLADALLALKNKAFIELALDYLPIKKNVHLGRTFSSDGTALSTYITLPLYDEALGEYSVEYTLDESKANKNHIFKIITSVSMLHLEYGEQKSSDKQMRYDGTLRVQNGNVDLGLLFTLDALNDVSVDVDGKNTLKRHFDFLIKGEESSAQKVDEVNLSFHQNFTSGVAKNASTHIETEVKFENKTSKELVKLILKERTAKPWDINSQIPEEVTILNLSSENDFNTLKTAIVNALKTKIEHIDSLKLLQPFFTP